MSATNPIEDNVARLISFIIEREAVRVRKERGDPWPWTQDPILREYRFCCVHREDDAVTRWIAKNVRELYIKSPDLWHLLTMCRLFNEPETIAAIMGAKMVEFGDDGSSFRELKKAVLRRQSAGERIFNPAYMITTAGKKQDKIDYIFELLQELWSQRERLRPQLGDTLNSYHMLLGQFQGLGSFLTAQVVADLKYVEPLRSASDWHTFAASGSGSRRGMNYILSRDPKSPWQEDDWRQKLNKLQTATSVQLKRHKIELHAQDLQNCLCEWSKMERARLTGQMPKQRYRHV